MQSLPKIIYSKNTPAPPPPPPKIEWWPSYPAKSDYGRFKSVFIPD